MCSAKGHVRFAPIVWDLPVQASTKYKLASLRASRRCPLLALGGHALLHCTHVCFWPKADIPIAQL